MKIRNLFVAAIAVVFAACETPYYATDTGVLVPESTQISFTEQYPKATNIAWSSYDPDVVIINDWELTGWTPMDASDFVVSFDMDNEKYYAWYDNDGTWVGTAYVVTDYTLLPSNVHATLNSQYPGYSISRVNRVFEKDRVAYEIVTKNGNTKATVLIDNDGVIIKQKTKPLY